VFSASAARDNGEVALANHRDVVVGWFESPAYTSDMEDARTLLDAHPDVRPAEPMPVCALALRIKAAKA
jgi:hypothetical protein